MKKIIALLCAAMMVLGLAACNSAPNNTGGKTDPSDATVDDNTPANDTPAINYPAYSVNIVCPFGAGGDTDTTARGAAAALSEIYGKAFTVNNVTGGTGTVALSYMYNANPDGYTLMWYQSDCIYQTILGRTEKAWDEAFKVVGVVAEGTTDTFVVRSNDDRFQTFDEMVEWAKANPGQLNIGTEAGGYLHMCLLKMEEVLGIDINPVSCGGGSARVTALLSGEIDVNFGAYGAMAAYVESGDFHPIAVGDSKQNELLNEHCGYELPSVYENYGLELPVYKIFFLLAPYDTPDEVVDELASVMPRVTESESFLTSLESYFFQPICYTGNEALNLMHEWQEQYTALCEYYQE